MYYIDIVYMIKTIRIDDELHARIGKLVGSKAETYQDILRRVIEFYEKNYKSKK